MRIQMEFHFKFILKIIVHCLSEILLNISFFEIYINLENRINMVLKKGELRNMRPNRRLFHPEAHHDLLDIHQSLTNPCCF